MTSRRVHIALVLAGLLLTACGPVSPEHAARECEERAQAAKGVNGQVRVGAGTGGVTTGLDLAVTTDFLRGRDPQEVYIHCVEARTGQAPHRPPRL